MAAGPEYLFVYGTLMQGFSNPFAQKLHASSVFKGNGSFPGLLYKIDWYPGAVYEKDSESTVYGEVYELQNVPDLIRELDEYEEVFEDENVSLYVRRIVPVKMEDESVLDCWIYLYNQPVVDLVKIESGIFRG
ncbi:gamma-glutamylcyclotransferase [Dyadobacter sp. NIV53]|uniref:gamma-glutamylcyclotransferase family protein n=1 Tax=Dyadobacter sp. NIV53 TaxID=2861765 RepID=UPI001C889CB8|nr:gamma-glutamylcyclotransferase family protein [Dyadobacter sp. NIV53]